MNENETKTIAKLDKNTAEEIRFSFAEWHDKKYVDIRVWVKADPEEGKEEQPTKKGIRFNLDLLDEFIKILQKINAGEAFGQEKPGSAEEAAAEEETEIPF
jgi:hypothetical protein